MTPVHPPTRTTIRGRSRRGCYFVVRELGGGKSNITIDYRIVARRNGYENIR